MADSGPKILKFSHDAMATTFDVIVAHDDPDHAGRAAEAVFDEIDRLERELSRFVESSDVSRISALGAGEAVVVGPDTFECLRLAGEVHAGTGGAFDPTVGAIFGAWFAPDGSPREPSADELARAAERTGLGLLTLGEGDVSVRVAAAGVALDLGGIGKGWAVDRAAEVLREWDIATALVNAGDSTHLAVGPAPEGGAWRLGLPDPQSPGEHIGAFLLEPGRSVSGSGTRRRGLHIIDPRTGRPTKARPAAWAAAPSAARSDALSTAFMVMSEDEVAAYCAGHDGVSAGLASTGPDGTRLVTFGRPDEWRSEA